MKRYIRSTTERLNPRERCRIAKYSKDPEELSRFAHDNARSVRLTVFKNPHTPDQVVDMLINEFVNDKDMEVRWAVARRTDDPEIFAQLAEDEDWNVRRAVALRTDDPQLLEQLANDENKWVRQSVAENKNTDDPEILAQLADDEDWYTRVLVKNKLNQHNEE